VWIVIVSYLPPEECLSVVDTMGIARSHKLISELCSWFIHMPELAEDCVEIYGNLD
jgi:hypothetical protein